MYVVVTSIQLKNPFKFFSLSRHALSIIRQLKNTNCLKYTSRGFWNLHYTMTLWNTKEELQAFARSGAHSQAMGQSAEIAKEIRTYTYQADRLPDWKEAKILLKQVNPLAFS
jgi:hypothetical protein